MHEFEIHVTVKRNELILLGIVKVRGCWGNRKGSISLGWIGKEQEGMKGKKKNGGKEFVVARAEVQGRGEPRY